MAVPEFKKLELAVNTFNKNIDVIYDYETHIFSFYIYVIFFVYICFLINVFLYFCNECNIYQ